MAKENINYLHNKKEGLVSVTWDNIVLAHGTATALNGGYLVIFLFLYILLI